MAGGWLSYVKVMPLDCSKLKALGWQPQLNSRWAVERTLREEELASRG
jgi:hypothetical protein